MRSSNLLLPRSSRLSKYLDRNRSWMWHSGARQARQTSKAMNNNAATNCARARNSPCPVSKGGAKRQMASRLNDFRSRCFFIKESSPFWRSRLLSISTTRSPTQRSPGHKKSNSLKFCSSKMYLGSLVPA